jgi:hypothetical protein
VDVLTGLVFDGAAAGSAEAAAGMENTGKPHECQQICQGVAALPDWSFLPAFLSGSCRPAC